MKKPKRQRKVRTFCGLPIITYRTMPVDSVEIRDRAGNLFATFKLVDVRVELLK